MRRTVSKDLPRKAEVALEWWLRERQGCVVVERAKRGKFFRQDLFGGDAVGKDKEGRWYVGQVTTGGNSALSNRRRKLESIPWGPEDSVYLLQLKVDKAKRKHRYYFRIQGLLGGEWSKWREEEVPREWFAAWGSKEKEVCSI